MKKLPIAIVVALLIVGGTVAYIAFAPAYVSEYLDPEPKPDSIFKDDPAPDSPPPFDETLVDSRRYEGWEINKSAAVLRLDLRPIRPGREAHLEKIYPTYDRAVSFGGKEVIPSVNLLDSKCKVFDDSLYAAVDLAAFKGVSGRLAGIESILARLWPRLSGDAAEFIAAASTLAGITERKLNTRARKLHDAFMADEFASRPVGFYNWNKELQSLFRTERFLARELSTEGELAVAAALSKALRSDKKLLADYMKLVGLFRRLTSPYVCLSLDQLPEGELTTEALSAASKKHGTRRATVSFLPPSTCREAELLERLGLASGKALMRELVKRIRSGEIDLAPRKNAGWYEHQVFALEPLLLPGKGPEKGKLIFSARYKQRMLESFKAMLARRRETHARQTKVPKSAVLAGNLRVAPRLRLEPAPTYYLRTARAYDFVRNLLLSAFGIDLEEMYGTRVTWSYGQIRERKAGERDDDFDTELRFMRSLFYGLYLVSCEDVGLKPELASGERVDLAACRQAALNWIESFRRDPDLKPDARICVPVAVGPAGQVTHWSVVGVRLARLEVEYVHPPHLRREGDNWEKAPRGSLAKSDYLIPVDAFAPFTLRKGVLTRKEFWDALTAAGTRDAFLRMVRQAGSRKELLKLAAARVAARRWEEE